MGGPGDGKPIWVQCILIVFLIIFGIPSALIGFCLAILVYPLAYFSGMCLLRVGINMIPTFGEVFGTCAGTIFICFFLLVLALPAFLLSFIYRIFAMIFPCLPDFPTYDELRARGIVP